ncbi:hypothetical protein BKA70DRAFT_1445127 [Coprinopsis sp. MPI-PUGE-AT-0042]|nr:hypothetical protein BKA70DRAFT_1445127 [Coprinopsis sp. MPI-PUGE-AT-0042]
MGAYQISPTQVGERLFKVPKDRFLKGSSQFSTKFDLIDRHSPGPRENVAELEPVPLPDVSIEEFRSFLRCYARELAKDQWLSVLKLSTLWFFKDQRRASIARLEALELSPAERMSLGKRCHISRWGLTGYDSIVRNLDGLILFEDAKQVGYDTFEKELGELAQGEELHLPQHARINAAAENMDVDGSDGEDVTAQPMKSKRHFVDMNIQDCTMHGRSDLLAG